MPALFDLAGDADPYLVGILNVTPDSFSDGGLHERAADAISAGIKMAQAGAHIIDIGGESTAPGARPITPHEELSRIKEVVPVLVEHAAVSVDTFRSSTAKACLEMGAVMINDVSAMRFDPAMCAVVRDAQAWVVLMYSKETDAHPHASNSVRDYEDVVSHIISFLSRRIDYALAGGIKAAKIILDPGMGRFLSHDSKYSWLVLEQLARIKEAFQSFALMIATSRKGFLGGESGKRDPVSQLTALAAWQEGVSLIRTHNVAMAREFFDAWKKINPGSG